MLQENLIKPRGYDLFDADHMPLDIRQVMQVQELIAVHFREEHYPEFYAAIMKMPLRRLNTLLGDYLDKTVFELLQEALHREAVKLLLYTRMTVKEITYELNIANPSYFARRFRKVEGCSPKAFRCRRKLKLVKEA
ncbi:AraC-like DNA-binding protein [Pedobacter sp. AK017]|uniref:helix-turn-helix domain-containing protein n=1 Tax=Pedobacter sp. AK017 TaxID=2723073 RepID=UPI001610FFDE|nr:AraC family transcriptional regulator [Pedobacter sp. AK017]MBB5437278.1 AraC-like DNA-binding protein [Pedobacter sp. AK017]